MLLFVPQKISALESIPRVAEVSSRGQQAPVCRPKPPLPEDPGQARKARGHATITCVNLGIFDLLHFTNFRGLRRSGLKSKNASSSRDGADAAQPLGRGGPCHGVLLHPRAPCRCFLPCGAPGCRVAAEPFNGRQVGLLGRIQGAASHPAHHGGADELCAARWRHRRCWHGEETHRRCIPPSPNQPGPRLGARNHAERPKVPDRHDSDWSDMIWQPPSRKDSSAGLAF